jgi:predicted ATP-binding protein involved in virulence
MKLKKIKIENFRCFKSYEVSFAENTTVLFGKNGTGKTSLINSIKISLSFIFSKYKTQNEKLEMLGNTPDLHLANLSKTDAFFDNENRLYKYPISIQCIGTFNGDLEWAIVKDKPNGKLLDSKYREAFLTFNRNYNQDLKNGPLPLFAYFSDSYPHKKINIGSYAKSVLKSGEIPRAFAYYQWDAEANCAEIWQNRYIAQYSRINDFKNTDKDTIAERNEINFIDNRVKLFTAILDAKYVHNQELSVNKITLERPLKDASSISIKFCFEDNRVIFFEHLPQGYNRLISIVFDIAYRSYILNGEREPEGIILIDEIELHLHPSLQQEVIQRFKKAFPNIQFIFSTHSPLVLSNLKTNEHQNKVIRLVNDGVNYSNESVENIYGIDYTTGLMDIMDVPYRPSTIDNLIDSYVILKLRNKDVDALKILDEIFQLVGIDNAWIENEIKEKLTANR